MISHFQFQSLYENKELPGWKFSFFHHGKKYLGVYHRDGKIEWLSTVPDQNHEEKLKSHIHELMLYHVYDR
ncbi:YheE family protein [Cytobacillus sp. FSL K6-0129]|uniref:YheE family protein n=1 Tax=Cytobacillus sp. FSL K6-0129 TaxID=2921421 RepID=UPI0030F92EA4